MAMTLRTDEELEAALNHLTQVEGVSRQEVTRRALIERANKSMRRGQVAQLTREAMEEWAETLDRLGRE